METLARKDFGEYVEASQLKVPKRHVALRTQPHALDTDESDQTTSSEGVGLFIIDESDSEGSLPPCSRRKRMLLKHVLRQNDQLHTLCKTVEDVDEEILFYEAKLHHCRVVEDGNDYVQHAYLNEREESAPKSQNLIKHDQGSDLNHQASESGAYAPTSDTLDPNQAHKQFTNNVRVMEHLVKGDSPGSNVNDPNQSEVKSRTKKDFGSKSNTKIVVVNPLPRNELSSFDQKQTEKEILKDREGKSAITTQGLPVPRTKVPLSKTKRRTKNGSRSKRKIPGLYEFEQSCEWLKVMDKELKRLESIENLSFVDWDSESLLSEKQLTCASGNRKFRFRSAFSGKEFKKYDLNENLSKYERPTDLEQEFSKLQFENDRIYATSTSPDNRSEGAIINEVGQSLCKSDNTGDGNNQSVNGVGWNGGKDGLTVGTSETKPTDKINKTILSRSGEFTVTDRSELGERKTENVKTPSLPSYSGECTSVDDLDQKNKSPEFKSALCKDGMIAYHKPLSASSTTESVEQKRNSNHGDRFSASTSLKEDVRGRNSGNSQNRDHGTNNEIKHHKVTFNLENVDKLKVDKFASNISTPEMDIETSGSGSLQPNINAVESRQVSRNSTGIPSNFSKDSRTTSEMKDQSGNSNGSKALGPVLEPKSSPVSVRRVPKPPMYYPTEASGPVRHGPCEGQPVPRNFPRDTFLKPKSKNFSSGSNLVPEPKASVVTAMHPRVEQLRTTRVYPGAVSKTSGMKRDATLLSEGNKSERNREKLHELQTSLTVGLVVGTTEVKVETLETNTYDPNHSTPILPSAVTDLPLPRSSMKSPDQGLGPEIFSQDEKVKPQENDSSSDTGMSSLHSQDSGISNLSVVMETWV
ncbi:hypothetical protein HOLleu_36168 [Holothuria leucospilota]|uniref:Uncharacterized protein n=1 Tax=Holothuria leucospilota TaxID=206669 RepID=A0A9Q0YJD6_HOLLE|nr:hypothetical protein HOLleu_36168 [Holothuria leucospilota]